MESRRPKMIVMIDVLHFVPHLVTTYEFWSGAVGGSVLTLVGNVIKDRISDRRKFNHENQMQDRKDDREDDVQEKKETREDKLREADGLIAAAEVFTQVATEILVDTIDVKGAFNILRDLVNNIQGNDDPSASAKIDHSEKVAEAQKRITGPHTKLRLFADNDVLVAADRVATALFSLARVTTNPIAVAVAQRAAADEINNFSNVVRKQIGKSEYTPDDSKKAVNTFLNTLRRQTDDFVETSRDEMRAAGFTTTPWDNYQRKTPKAPDPVI
jgi:hypothetical protein